MKKVEIQGKDLAVVTLTPEIRQQLTTNRTERPGDRELNRAGGCGFHQGYYTLGAAFSRSRP